MLKWLVIKIKAFKGHVQFEKRRSYCAKSSEYGGFLKSYFYSCAIFALLQVL
jgi:hypothetical protein